jgi:hypothetical protein
MKCLFCHKEINDQNPEDFDFATEHKLNEDTKVCKICARKDRLEKRTEVFIEILAPLFKRSNSTLFNYDNIDAEALASAFCREHRYLQSELIIFLRAVLKILGQRAGTAMWTDGRNEHTFEYLRKLSEIDF